MNLPHSGQIAFSAALLLLMAACTQTRTAEIEMTWSAEHLPAPFHVMPPGAVRLTFVDAPHSHIGVQLPGLLEQLQRSGKRIVRVKMEIVYAHSTASWLRVMEIDGQAIAPPKDGWMEEVGTVGKIPIEAPYGDVCG